MPRTPPTASSRDNLKWKLMSLSHGQELCQLAASLSCAANQEPACLFTQFLTMTTTQNFPHPAVGGEGQRGGQGAGPREDADVQHLLGAQALHNTGITCFDMVKKDDNDVFYLDYV